MCSGRGRHEPSVPANSHPAASQQAPRRECPGRTFHRSNPHAYKFVYGTVKFYNCARRKGGRLSALNTILPANIVGTVSDCQLGDLSMHSR